MTTTIRTIAYQGKQITLSLDSDGVFWLNEHSIGRYDQGKTLAGSVIDPEHKAAWVGLPKGAKIALDADQLAAVDAILAPLRAVAERASNAVRALDKRDADYARWLRTQGE